MSTIEYSAANRANPEVLADRAAIKAAAGRGELVGHRYVRVMRDAAGRRQVVSADPSTDRLAAANDRERTAERARRLEAAERQCLTPADRERRLRRAEDAVYYDAVARIGGPLLRPVA